MARRTHRSAQRAADHGCCFYIDGSGMPLRLERNLHDGIRFVQGIGTGGRGASRQRLHERIRERQASRPILPSLRGSVPVWPACGRLIGYFLVPIYGWRACLSSASCRPFSQSRCAGSWWNRRVGCCPSVVSSRRAISSLAWKNGFLRRGISLEEPTARRSIRSTRQDPIFASFSKESISGAPSCSSHYGYART